MQAKQPTSVPKEVLKTGSYIARCISIIDLWSQYNSKYDNRFDKFRIVFELPNELRVFKEENWEQPMVLSKEMTNVLSKKSHLTAMLQSRLWTIPASFMLDDLLWKECLLSVWTYEKDWEEKNTINGVSPMIKGTTCPEQINPSFLFELDKFDMDKFNKLSDYTKEKIFKSQQREEIKNTYFADQIK